MACLVSEMVTTFERTLQKVLLSLRIFVLFLFFCLCSQHTYAMNLDDAIASSIRTHPSIKSKESDYESAVSDNDSAKWQRWFAISGQTQRANKKQEGYKNQNGGTVSLEQPIYTGGRISGNIDSSESKMKASKNAILEASQTISLRTTDAYGNALKLLKKLHVSTDNVAQHEKLVSSIANRLTGGISSEADVALAKARLNQARSELRQFDNAYKNALATLTLLTGQNISSIDDMITNVPQIKTLQEFISDASKNSPSIKKLQDEIGVANAEKELKKSILYPQLSIRAEKYYGVTEEMNRDGSRIYMVASMQPGAGFSSASSIEAASKKVLSTKSNLEALKLELSEQVTNQYNESRSLAEQTMETIEYVKEAQKVTESYERQYIIGKKSWLDLLNSKKELIQARYNLVDVSISETVASKKLLILTKGAQ
jgi:outer membrane protein, adhesin transport system